MARARWRWRGISRCLGRRLREELCEANARIADAKRDLAKREREIADLLATENIVVPHSIEGAIEIEEEAEEGVPETCLLYTSPSPRDATLSRMPSSA